MDTNLRAIFDRDEIHNEHDITEGQRGKNVEGKGLSKEKQWDQALFTISTFLPSKG